MRKRLIILSLIILTASLSWAAIPQVGEEAPDFTLPTLEGKNLQLSKLISNPGGTKAVVLSFFATWCKPCQYELPELEKIHQQYKDKGIKLVAISIDDEAGTEDIKKFVKRLGVTFPVVWDQEGKTARSYGVRPIPNTFVIGPDRKIEARYVGLGINYANLKAIQEKVRQLAK